MARTLTNNTSLRFVAETSLGSPPTSGWRVAEWNTMSAYGSSITKKARRPVSTTRGRRKGATIDRDSSVEFQTDMTVDAFTDFAEGFVFSEWANKEFDLKLASGLPPTVDGTNDEFDIAAASALLAGKVQFSGGSYSTLLLAKGYTNAANNGYHILDVDLASTDIVIGTASNLVTETPPTNASLQVVGVRVLDDADLTLTISGSTATLVSAAAISNWATLGIRAGMIIHVGSAVLTTGAVQNGLGTAGTQCYGFARVTSVSGATLNLDKLDSKLTPGAGPFVGAAGLSQDVLFGRFARNVPVGSNSDDIEYLERSYQFEATFVDLGGVGTPQYEYAVGNFANQLSWKLPLTDLGGLEFGFIGTTAENITSSRKTGPSDAPSPLRTASFSTASNIAVLSTDLIANADDVCFRDLTITLNNNVSPEKCLGTLGASFMNAGQFEVGLEGEMVFSSKEIVDAVRDNRTVTFQAISVNEDGAIALDIPSMTVGDGARDFPVDESVRVKLTGDTFTDSTYGYDVGISVLHGAAWVRD